MVFLGGFNSWNTTELVNNEGSTEYFTLQQPIVSACGIEMEDKVIITGGAFRGYLDASDKAIVYNDDGFVENLPPLRLGRWGHSCGHFITNTAEGSKVVYVVTGGNGGISAYFNELKKP